MRRRVLLLSSLGLLSVAACAGVLGDFSVASDGDTTVDGSTSPDGNPTNDGSSSGSTGDGSSSSSSGASSTSSSSGSSSTSSSGGTTDGGAEGGSGPQPTGLAVATSANATCAIVQYPAQKITWCWGEKTTGAVMGLGAVGGQAAIGQYFYRPAIAIAGTGPGTGTGYPALSTIVGAGSGDWFLGLAADNGPTYAWGDSSKGQCSITAPAYVSPTVVKTTTNTTSTAIAASALFAAPGIGCGAAGKQFICWGENDACQVTSGSACDLTEAPRDEESEYKMALSPGDVPSSVDLMAGGAQHTCVARRSQQINPVNTVEEVACWGQNGQGQTGQTSNGLVTAPTAVSGVTASSTATYELASGTYHTCFVDKLASNLYCWGDNSKKQSDPSGAETTTPAGTTINLAGIGVDGALSNLTLGGTQSCVVRTPKVGASKAYCWGTGSLGGGLPNAKGFSEVAGIENVTQLAVGSTHACAVANSTNSSQAQIFCWGGNTNGETAPGSTATSVDTPTAITFPTVQ